MLPDLTRTADGRRSRVQPLVGGIEIVIPARAGFHTAFLGAWLGGWAFGEVSAVVHLTRSGVAAGFLFFWLAGWTLGGAWALAAFLWSLVGRERIVATREQLVVIHELGPWRRARHYSSSGIGALRVIEGPAERELAVPFIVGGSGPLAFDHGFRTVRLAAGVSPAEARVIATELTRHACLPPDDEAGRRRAPGSGVPV